VCVFGADHIYKMDVRQMLARHRAVAADLTVAAIPVPIEEASAFGIMKVDENGQIIGFQEKPDDPAPMPNDPDHSLASMGNYIFTTGALVHEVERDAADEDSAHDFGKSIVTKMVNDQDSDVFAYDFSTNIVPGQPENERGYWRDVGTVDSYWQASMDLINIDPVFDLYNDQWPVRTQYKHHAPAKFVHEDLSNNRVGRAMNSSVAEGCIVSGGTIRNCILFPEVRVNSFSNIEDSVLFEHVDIGRRARIRRTIIDKGVQVPPDEVIGYDLERDRERFVVSDEGIVVVPKGYTF
jgi:glucose-1-phosphate adenylyltransferase